MMALEKWTLPITAAAFSMSLLVSTVAVAQPRQVPDTGQTVSGMTCHCPMAGMHGAVGVAGMIVVTVFLLSAIAALVALTLFLLRRSRTHVP